MRIWSIDREGWSSCFETPAEVEGSLEWQDLAGGEYVLVDEDGQLYAWEQSESAPNGYVLVRDARKHREATAVLERVGDGDRLDPEELELVRRHGPSRQRVAPSSTVQARADAEYDREKVEEVVMALLTLTMFREHGVARAWKGQDWDVMEALFERGWIGDPKNKARSVIITPEGETKARELFERYFGSGRAWRHASPEAMTIEPFDESMLEEVVDLSLRAWEPVFRSMEQALLPAVYRAFFGDDWRAAQRLAVEAACADPETEVGVALESHRVAGFVALKLHAGDRMGEIHMIAVDPERQRQGIARRLTEHALDRFRAAGMSIAMVETGADPGHAPARRAYEAAGFERLAVARYFREL